MTSGRAAPPCGPWRWQFLTTLPIALTVAGEEGRIAPGSRVLVASFGGGFTWGAAVIGWR